MSQESKLPEYTIEYGDKPVAEDGSELNKAHYSIFNWFRKDGK